MERIEIDKHSFLDVDRDHGIVWARLSRPDLALHTTVKISFELLEKILQKDS